jgi:hypothetical protein
MGNVCLENFLIVVSRDEFEKRFTRKECLLREERRDHERNEMNGLMQRLKHRLVFSRALLSILYRFFSSSSSSWQLDLIHFILTFVRIHFQSLDLPSILVRRKRATKWHGIKKLNRKYRRRSRTWRKQFSLSLLDSTSRESRQRCIWLQSEKGHRKRLCVSIHYNVSSLSFGHSFPAKREWSVKRKRERKKSNREREKQWTCIVKSALFFLSLCLLIEVLSNSASETAVRKRTSGNIRA